MTSQLLVTSQMLDHMSETFAGRPAQQQLRPLEARRERGSLWVERVSPRATVGRKFECVCVCVMGAHFRGQEHLTHACVSICGHPESLQLEKTHACLHVRGPQLLCPCVSSKMCRLPEMLVKSAVQ